MTLTLAQARTILDNTLAAARAKKLKPWAWPSWTIAARSGLCRGGRQSDHAVQDRVRKAFGSVGLAQARADCIRSGSSARTWRLHWWRSRVAPWCRYRAGCSFAISGDCSCSGVSGDTSDNDEAAAVAGIEASGFVADTGA